VKLGGRNVPALRTAATVGRLKWTEAGKRITTQLESKTASFIEAELKRPGVTCYAELAKR
jgi:hypothetical protein